jgi:hypothetical protein
LDEEIHPREFKNIDGKNPQNVTGLIYILSEKNCLRGICILDDKPKLMQE